MNTNNFRRLGLSLAAAASFSTAGAATFEDIEYWVGSGTNRAALVIEWPGDGDPVSLLWGYRWNGTATGLEMLDRVVRADPWLYGHFGEFAWGVALFGLGYDLDRRNGFGVNPALDFGVDGLRVDVGASDADDARGAIDAGDPYLEGWNTGFWAYYLKHSAAEEWASALTGSAGRTLTDGAWDGYRFAPNFSSAAPSDPAPARAPTPFAVEIVAAEGPFGAAPYEDPTAVLGRPATDFHDLTGGWSGGSATRRVKLVEAAYHRDPTQTHPLLVTVAEGGGLVVRFERPVRDDPAHPYGIDLLVFGNAFYTPNGFVNDATDMNTLRLAGGGFFEAGKVSVSPGYTGEPGQSPDEPGTWPWYRYEDGPYADGAFPTQAYRWDREAAAWTEEWMDFTKPVNPALAPLFLAGGPEALSAAEAIALYAGSGGGTGFDLAESGFASIQYVKVEGLPGFSGAEIDAFAAVRPAVLGDGLSVAPGNLTDGTARLHFHQREAPARPAVSVAFTALDDVVRVAAAALPGSSGLAAYGSVLVEVGFEVAPLLGNAAGAFEVEVRLATGSGYSGDGRDLALLRRVGEDWEGLGLTFDEISREVVVAGLTDLPALALLRVHPPRLAMSRAVDGEGEPVDEVGFSALPGFHYQLERSEDLVHWGSVGDLAPLVAHPAVLRHGGSPGKAFYRVRMEGR